MHFKASSRTGHLISTGSWPKMAGNKLLMANGVMFSQIAIAAASHAAFTSGFLLLEATRPI